MQTDPLAAAPLRLNGTPPAGLSLRPGQVFLAVVRGDAAKPFLQLPQGRIPLDPAARLPLGQTVRVEILETGASLRLQLSTPPATGAAPGNALDALLAEVLRTLGKPELSQQAAGLTPPRLPSLEAPLRQLFTVLLAKSGFGEDLRQLGTLLEQAATPAQLPAAWIANLAGLLGPLTSLDAEQLRGLLARMGQARSLEARIALALQAGAGEGLEDALATDLKALLLQLKDHAPLRAFLNETRQTKTFDGLIERLLERVQGGEHQNLNSLERPYVFLNLPVPPASGFHHAQVHFFGDAPAARSGRAAYDRVVLDCSTSRLGDLWVELQASGSHCACRFRVADSAVAGLLESTVAELQDALATAGFPDADVRVERWDGDRLRELLGLMRPFHGMNLHV